MRSCKGNSLHKGSLNRAEVLMTKLTQKKDFVVLWVILDCSARCNAITAKLRQNTDEISLHYWYVSTSFDAHFIPSSSLHVPFYQQMMLKTAPYENTVHSPTCRSVWMITLMHNLKKHNHKKKKSYYYYSSASLIVIRAHSCCISALVANDTQNKSTVEPHHPLNK